MSDISCLHHGDSLKVVIHGFHRTFIVNSLLVLYLQKSERALLPSMFTHKEFDLVKGASSAEESVDIVQNSAADTGITQQRWSITLK